LRCFSWCNHGLAFIDLPEGNIKQSRVQCFTCSALLKKQQQQQQQQKQQLAVAK
jgi:hypothetical protein